MPDHKGEQRAAGAPSLTRDAILLLVLTGLPGFSETVHEPITDAFLARVRARAAEPSAAEPNVIPLVEGDVRVDGVLDEAFWDQALVWALPYEIRAGRNNEAPMETYALLASTREKLLAAFVNLDPDPAAVRGAFADRDRWNLTSDDAVGLYLDTYGDRRNAYSVIVNARGIQYDALRLDRGGQGTHDDASFDFRWYSEARPGKHGYVVEIALPFQHLRVAGAGGGMVWGVMPFRRAPRDFRYEMTAFPWDYNRNCFLCQFPTVTLAKPETSFRPWQIIPYVAGGVERAGDAGETRLAGGADMKFQSSAWVLDATFRPDFSQVETDAFLLTTNIRFQPRLAERRPFFMERADLFRFPISDTIYTRTMLDPNAGARWTGKLGAHNWAVLGLHDRATSLLFPGVERSRNTVMEDTPSWNGIARYRYDHSAKATMGVFLSERQYEGGFNRVFSADGQLAVGSRHTLVAQLLATSNRYPEEQARAFSAREDTFHGLGYLLRANRSGRAWSYSVETRDYGDDLVTGMGFLQRVGIRRGSASTSSDFGPEGEILRQYGVAARFDGVWDRSALEPLNLSTRLAVNASGTRQTFAEAYVQQEKERYAGRMFELRDAGVEVASTPLAWYQFEASASAGTAIDYRLTERMKQFNAGLGNNIFAWQRRIRVAHTLDRFRLHHQVTAQEAWIQRVQGEVQFTRRLGARNIAQWRSFRWRDPRYGASVAPRRDTLENQSLLRYRINYATALHWGIYSRTEKTTEAPNQWNMFFKLSLLL